METKKEATPKPPKPSYEKPEIKEFDVSLNERIMVVFAGTKSGKQSCTTHNHTCGWPCDATQ